jgi:type IV pilus assembly protein PilA
MKKIQHGFTLIELMIVVAIIGILAAVAIPSYQDYTKRAYVTEGMVLVGAVKTGIAEFYSSNGAMPLNNSSAGVSAPTLIAGNSVTSVAVGANDGVITITYNAKVGATAGSTITIVAGTANAGSITWTCTGGTVPSKYRPATCR